MTDTRAHDDVVELRARLAEVEDALNAIRSAAVDAITVSTPSGEQVYSLRGAEQPYREMIEAMSEGAVSVTPEGMVLYCNPYFARLARADLHTIAGTSLLAYFTDRDRARISTAQLESRTGATRIRAHLLTADGAQVPVSVAMHALKGADFMSTIVITSDLTQVVSAQEAANRVNLRLEQANRALHMLDLCHTGIIRATDEGRVLTDTCRALVDSGGYLSAWIGFAEQDERRSIRPVASANDASVEMGAADFSWADDERGSGPVGTAVRTGRMTVVRDNDMTIRAWREMARGDSVQSAAAIPLRSGGDVFGVLVVCSGRLDAFDEQESIILTELADDVAFCVTNRRQEQKLAETKAFLDNILQSSTRHSIISEDLQRIILYWNQGARRNYGYVAEEVVGKSQDILHTPEDCASGAVDRLMEVARVKGLAEAEVERVRKDGSRFPAGLAVTRRDDAAGNPIGYLVISTDITEKREADEKLRSASQYARSLLEANLDPMLIIAPDGRITDVNHAAELITGQMRDQLIGTDFAIYFTEPPKARAGHNRVFTRGFLIDYPLAIRHNAGTVTEVLCNASLYQDAEGEVAGVFLTARDMSRVPLLDALGASRHRWSLGRYLAYAAAAVLVAVAVSATSLGLRGWLQQWEEQASIGRSMDTNARMLSLLAEVPGAARARAAKVQNQGDTDAAFTFTPTYAVAAPNHSPGIIGKAVPMSRFAGEMAAFSAGDCVRFTQQQSDQVPPVSNFITCPIATTSHRLIGLLFLSWDLGDPVPANFDRATAATRQAALDIAAIWSGTRR